MGLDQYAYAVMPNPENTDFSIAWADQSTGMVKQIASWRKHPDLQGWMEALWSKKMALQGVALEAGTVFNCEPLRLSYDDLLELRRDVEAEVLPHTEDFFFGESLPEDKETTLKFVEDALKAMSQDMEIYYDSWW